MKLTFIIPPVFDGNKQPAERTAGCTRVVYLAPNIYELTVAAVLEAEGKYAVAYEDFVYDKRRPADFEKFVSADDSDIYFIWTVNLSLDSDALATEVIRRHRSGTYIVYLGPGATYFPGKILKNDHDIVVRGEPEQTVKELVAAIASGDDWHDIAGITYLDNSGGKLRRTGFRPMLKDLDSLPLPARHLIAGKRYYNPKLKIGPYTTAVTSRNCPFHCIYCVPSSLTFAREIEYRHEFGKKPPISFKSLDCIDREMKELSQAGYKAVGFMDDNFIWNEERTRGICDIMRRYGLVWGCQARVDAITEPIAKMLSESGCHYVDLGVESFDDRILQYIKKGITSKQIYESIGLLKKYGVPVKLNVLIGCSPLETKETIRHTLHEAKKLHVDQVMFNIVSPFPGTEFYEIVKKNGWMSTPDYVPTDVQRESILNYPSLTSKEMEKMLFYNNLSYFLSPRFIVKQIKRFSNWSEFAHALKALKIKLFG